VITHINGATGQKTTAHTELAGIDADTGGRVWLVHTVHPYDTARGDWLETDDQIDPDAVLMVTPDSLIRERVTDAA